MFCIASLDVTLVDLNELMRPPLLPSLTELILPPPPPSRLGGTRACSSVVRVNSMSAGRIRGQSAQRGVGEEGG